MTDRMTFARKIPDPKRRAEYVQAIAVALAGIEIRQLEKLRAANRQAKANIEKDTP